MHDQNWSKEQNNEVIYYMPMVKLKEHEPFDVALRRFKRSCEKAGVLSEVRRREFYEKPTQVRKRKQAAAVKRQIKKNARETLRGRGRLSGARAAAKKTPTRGGFRGSR